MWEINSYTLCYLLLLVSAIPGPTAALVLSTALEIQSNQSLPLETPSPANALFAPPFPPKPPLPPQPPLPPSPPIRRLICFPPTQKGVMTPNVQDCEAAIEIILHIYPPGPLVPLNFSRSDGGNYRFPEAWMVKNCQIMITSLNREPDVWDMIRLVDIVVGAREVLGVCVPQSKFGFAGYAVIGDKGSYVTVNGWKMENGMNATSAVENPLLTGVSGLALGDGLDEDGELNVT